MKVKIRPTKGSNKMNKSDLHFLRKLIGFHEGSAVYETSRNGFFAFQSLIKKNKNGLMTKKESLLGRFGSTRTTCMHIRIFFGTNSKKILRKICIFGEKTFLEKICSLKVSSHRE